MARYHEIGRAVATIMSDELFHEVAYKAKKREHLLAGIDEFLGMYAILFYHRNSLPAEVDNNLRFPLHMDYLVLFWKLFLLRIWKNHPQMWTPLAHLNYR